MKYQVKEEHETHFLVHDGKTSFKVAKKGLEPNMIEKIKSQYPIKMADGGEVPGGGEITDDSLSTPASDRSPASDLPPTSQDAAQNLIDSMRGGISNVGSALFKNDPVTPDEVAKTLGYAPPPTQTDVTKPVAPASVAEAPKAAAPQPHAGTAPEISPYGDINSILKKETGAIQGNAKAQSQQAQDIGRAQQDFASAAQNNVQMLHDTYNKIDAEQAPLRQAIADQKIDPNRLWHDSGTGNKVAASLALIFGGIGAGLTHGPNQALQVMQNAANRDIEAQRSELGKKETLYSMNLGRYKNADAAFNATQLQTNTILQGKIAAAMAKSGSQQAINNGTLAMAELQKQAIPLKIQQTIFDAKAKGQEIDPATQIRYTVPEKEQAEAFKALQTAQNMTKAKDNILDSFDQIQGSGLNTVANRAAHLGFEPAKVAALRDPVLAQLVKDSEGRVTPTDIPMIGALFPAPGDSDSTGKLKRAKLNQFITQKMNFPELTGRNISLPKGLYDVGGQKTIKESKPNI